MPIFLWIAFVVAVLIAVFAVQNSDAQAVTIRFLFWSFETSLVYALLGSVVLGIVVTLLVWMQRTMKRSMEARKKPSQEQGTGKGSNQTPR